MLFCNKNFNERFFLSHLMYLKLVHLGIMTPSSSSGSHHKLQTQGPCKTGKALMNITTYSTRFNIQDVFK